VTLSTPHAALETAGMSTTPSSPVEERFAFGANWRRFLATIDESRVQAAVDSLQDMLGEDALAGRRFLDAGCGSGLFSLAAVRCGAQVVSFDFDPECVRCAQTLKERFADDSAAWEIRQGSVVDETFLAELGEFDVVYSWGVLHHTGRMWEAMAAVVGRVAPQGLLWIAIYNDQGIPSRLWTQVKQLYQKLPCWLRAAYVVVVAIPWAAWRVFCVKLPIAIARLVLSPIKLDASLPVAANAGKSPNRGMHWWYDLVDWIGGWPFEVATPEAVVGFYRDRRFSLVNLRTVGSRLGCNEFLFRRRAPTESDPDAGGGRVA